MTLDRPILFIASAKPEASLAFYRDVLQLELVADEPWAVVFDVHGTMLRIQKTPSLTPQPHTVLGWHVEDIDSTIRDLTTRGVQMKRYDHMEQDALGVWSSGVAKVAWFEDPDGNVLSLTAWPVGQPG